MAQLSSAARVAILCWLFCFGSAFQTPAEDSVSIVPRVGPVLSAVVTPAAPAHLRVDSSLVLIPVHVTTPYGASVTDLNRENFRLFEDDVEQKITHFAWEDAPVSIGLVFDASGSMQNKIRKASEAVAAFFKTANAEDEFFLVEFNERAKLTVPFTPDSDEVSRRVAHIRPFGRTSLLDAIHLASATMKNARNLRKAIVILSDGGDNRSRYTASEIKDELIESDVQVYAMGIFEPEDSRKRTPEEENGPHLLEEIAGQTGGQLYSVDRLDDLTGISDRIGNELRSQYLLGYSSANDARDGKYRHVKVKVVAPPDEPNLRTYYRQGYRAPGQ